MATMFSMSKAERSKTRRLPLLPRIGVVVDIAGRKFTFRYAPLLETVMNLKGRGLNVKNLRAVLAEELAEIRFPSLERGLATVRDLTPKVARVVRKGAAKAASAKKTEETL